MLGGTSNFWGGQLVRFDPMIFDGRDWLDHEPWPIRFSSLKPYYDKFDQLLGLPDISDAELCEQLNISDHKLNDDLEYFFSRWLKNPNLGQVFRGDLAGGALTTLIHANVVGFKPRDDRTGLDSIQMRTLTGRPGVVRAKRVVLACGTLEIARLLMLPFVADATGSYEPSPTGWGTSSWLGRGFMDHLDCPAGEVTVHDQERFHDLFDSAILGGLKYQTKLKMSRDAQKRLHTLEISGQFTFRSDYAEHISNLKLFVRNILAGRPPSDLALLPSYLAALWKFGGPLAMRYLRSNRVFNPGDAGVHLQLSAEQWPNPDSRIRLSEERDALNMPKIEVNWVLDGRELETMASFAESVRDCLEEARLATLVIDPLLASRDAAFLSKTRDFYHQMGGARMAESPLDGVVDVNLKVHGCDNLFVAGAAVFPTTGFANPTLTGAALGLRLADHLMGARS